MRARQLSRRALLASGAAALTACSASGPVQPPSAPASDSPETVLLKGLIAEKERTIALYSTLISGSGEKAAARLVPFRDRHQSHLNELRKHVTLTPPASPATPVASPSTAKVSLARLRRLESKAAAERPRQLAAVSPGLAQLIASIGACEAAHVLALPRSL
ncbi:hypothetical protein AB0I81_63085 [Nonomuraea sp. NPDC050404]|uniref:hypothetical protein n=1 Tax=Nonomuraea sp. NPDC050404 TaxID=3155783 RepID=UPI00340B8B62